MHPNSSRISFYRLLCGRESRNTLLPLTLRYQTFQCIIVGFLFELVIVIYLFFLLIKVIHSKLILKVEKYMSEFVEKYKPKMIYTVIPECQCNYRIISFKHHCRPIQIGTREMRLHNQNHTMLFQTFAGF